MTNLELQRLRDLPIEGVAERLGLVVKHHKSLCPFHDDHAPSLSFNQRRNTYRCFVCGASGGTIDLVMNYLHKDFLDACRWLNGDLSLTLPQGEETEGYKRQKVYSFDASRYERFFLRPFLNEAARHFLYDERKIDERVVRWCRLTSWTDKHGISWLQIPYYDREGKLIGIQNRRLNAPSISPQGGGLVDTETSGALGCQGASRSPSSMNASSPPSSPLGEVGRGPERGLLPRFRFPTGSHCSIYNLPVLNLLRPSEPLYITEGCSDCWAMLSSGHKAIAIPSATLLNPMDISILTSLSDTLATPFHMYPDRDEPGERLFLALQKHLPNLQHHHLPLGCKDYSDYYLSER